MIDNENTFSVNKEPGDTLIVVDVQNDFMPGGALAVTDGHEVVPIINRLSPGSTTSSLHRTGTRLVTYRLLRPITIFRSSNGTSGTVSKRCGLITAYAALKGQSCTPV